MGAYSREYPSARYRELLGFYRHLHEAGDPARGETPEETFNGHSLLPHGGTIKLLIEHFGGCTLLDYGSGKGWQYGKKRIRMNDGRRFESLQEFWGVDEIVCYDPAYPGFDTLPDKRFDIVICTDVLEHCPEEDLPWIVTEIFGFAERFVFATVALYRANKVLPNGENAHCTVRPRGWWEDLIRSSARMYPGVAYRIELYADSPTSLYGEDLASEVIEG